MHWKVVAVSCMMYRATCTHTHTHTTYVHTMGIIDRIKVTYSVNVGVVQSCIDLIQHKEWCRLITRQRKKQCDYTHCFNHRVRIPRPVNHRNGTVPLIVGLLYTYTHTISRTHTNLCMEKSSARAATVFSPPDRLSMGRNLLPGAMQL